jgi:hypothetical protein
MATPTVTDSMVLSVSSNGIATARLCDLCGQRPATLWYDPNVVAANSTYRLQPSVMRAVCQECSGVQVHCACCSKREA